MTTPKMSRESRAMLLNVLWHHQGGSSPVGQPLRKLLGIEQHDHLTAEQLSEAKWIDALLAKASGAYGVQVVCGSSEPRPPCTVCAKPASEHGSYPTCATHPYTADENCQHIIGARCVGAECQNGCVRARGVLHGEKQE